VALGLVGRPSLLFLDEPTTGFDPQARAEFHKLVEVLKTEGVTIVLTTHDLAEAERLADRVGVLLDGVIGIDAPPEQLDGAAGRQSRVAWVERDGRHRSELTEDPDGFVHRLMTTQGPVSGLRIERPSLEEVYMRIVEGAR
jgi:ABC-2 type transport system ATP-binding protein